MVWFTGGGGSLVLAPVGESTPAQIIGEDIHCQALQLITAADGVGGNAAALVSDLHAAGEQGQDHGVGCGAGVGGVEIHGGDGEVVGEGRGVTPARGTPCIPDRQARNRSERRCRC